MSEHPVLIPTSMGPVEGVVTEPDDVRRATLMFMQGRGRSGRYGVNAVWTRTARELSDLGFTVLRADYPRARDGTEGATRGAMADARERLERDVALRHEVADWFTQAAGNPDLLLAGSCYGARVAIHLAARNRAVSKASLIAPYVVMPPGRWQRLRQRVARGERAIRIDPSAAADLGQVVERMPVAIVFGEHDEFDAAALRRAVGAEADGFDLDVLPGLALHPVHSPEVQEAVRTWTVRWAAGALAEPAVAEPQRSTPAIT